MRPVPFESRKPAKFAHQALVNSVRAEEEARQCAVLWFGEIMKRQLYRELGYSSVNRYAREALGFSKTRTGDYIQLARKLDRLPAVKSSRRELEVKVARAKKKAATAGVTVSTIFCGPHDRGVQGDLSLYRGLFP